MTRKLASTLAVVASLTLGVVSPVVFAQDAASTASAPVSAKKAARAQRKAERKAAHARNKKELSTLEKNGYDPAADNANYPANIQQAQKKAGAASSPAP